MRDDYNITMQTELDAFDFHMSDLSVDIAENNATTLNALNDFTEQIVRLETFTSYFYNTDIENKSYYLLKHKEYIKKCFDIFERYNYI